MDQRIVNDQVAFARQGGGDGGIGGKAGGKIQRRLGAEESGGFFLQRFMLGMIAAKQARAARTHRHTARQRFGGGVAQGWRFRQREKIIGGEIAPHARRQCTQPPLGGQRVQYALMGIAPRKIVSHRGAWIPHPPSKGKFQTNWRSRKYNPPANAIAAGRVMTQAMAMERRVDHCRPDPLAAMVPATPLDRMCVVETGTP